jgi:membrane associated rhomboid family serine protease
MKKINYAYDSNIILDKCEKCNGIWTDHDEIMRLAIFRKGNPVLDRMGSAIAHDRGEMLKERYSDSNSYNSSRWHTNIGFRIILPLSDDQERSTFPFLVVTIIAVNIIIFALQSFFIPSDSIQKFYCQFGFVSSSAFTSIHGGYSIFTSMFIHGSLIHLIGNMLFLWIFADNIEDKFGHIKFVFIYLACGLAATFLYYAIHPHSTIPRIGASGAIAGMMGAYIVLYPAAKIKTMVYGYIVDIPAYAYLGGWFVLQLVSAYIERNRIGGGVGWFAHIGGFIAGLLFGIIAKYADNNSAKNLYSQSKNKIKDFDPKEL